MTIKEASVWHKYTAEQSELLKTDTDIAEQCIAKVIEFNKSHTGKMFRLPKGSDMKTQGATVLMQSIRSVISYTELKSLAACIKELSSVYSSVYCLLRLTVVCRADADAKPIRQSMV